MLYRSTQFGKYRCCQYTRPAICANLKGIPIGTEPRDLLRASLIAGKFVEMILAQKHFLCMLI